MVKKITKPENPIVNRAKNKPIYSKLTSLLSFLPFVFFPEFSQTAMSPNRSLAEFTKIREIVAPDHNRIDPIDFLALGQTSTELLTGKIDAAPSINAALNAARVVNLSCGTYKLDSPLMPKPGGGYALRGEAASCVELRYTFAAGDVLLFDEGLRNEVSDITFYGTVARNDGSYVIHIKNTYGTTLTRVAFDGIRNGDIYIDGANTTHIDAADFRPGNAGECLVVGGKTKQSVDSFISNTNMAKCGVGLHVTNASGVYLSNMDILASLTNAVHINPLATLKQNVNAVRTVNVLADSSANHGWLIDGNGAVTELHLIGSWVSGSGVMSDGQTYNGPYAGIYVSNSNLDGMMLQSLYGHRNGAQLVDLEAGVHIKISDAMACENSAYTANGYDGINIGRNTDYVTLTDITSGQCGYPGKVANLKNQQRYGLTINNDGSQHVTVVGGQFDSNVTGSWKKDLEVNFVSSGTPP